MAMRLGVILSTCPGTEYCVSPRRVWRAIQRMDCPIVNRGGIEVVVGWEAIGLPAVRGTKRVRRYCQSVA